MYDYLDNTGGFGSDSDGKSAYQLAQDSGFTGNLDAWILSLNGTNGTDGHTPVKGVDYFDGTNGTNGEKGDKGDKGDTGDVGPKGDNGGVGSINVIKPASDSTNAVRITKANGTTDLLSVDTINGIIAIGSSSTYATNLLTVGDPMGGGGYYRGIDVGNTSGCSIFNLGQANNRCIQYRWDYSSVPDWASANLCTYAYANPIYIDASQISLGAWSGCKVGVGTSNPTSVFNVVGLVEYADNATALANGLTVGAFYRTGDLLKIVH